MPPAVFLNPKVTYSEVSFPTNNPKPKKKKNLYLPSYKTHKNIKLVKGKFFSI